MAEENAALVSESPAQVMSPQRRPSKREKFDSGLGDDEEEEEDEEDGKEEKLESEAVPDPEDPEDIDLGVNLSSDDNKSGSSAGFVEEERRNKR